MSEVPKYDKLMIPTLRALKALGGSASNDELLDRVALDLAIPDDVRDLPHGDTNQTELAYRMAWARTYLRQVDAIDRSERGVWTLTDHGETLTESDITDIKRKVQALAIDRRKAEAAAKGKRQEKAKLKATASTPLPARTLVALPEEAEFPEDLDQEVEIADWKGRLLASVGSMKPDAFERLCQRILRESGFIRVEVTGRSGDGGIDGVGVLRMNLVSFHVLFQSKRWAGSVGSPEVRNFRGAMQGRADKGLIITTGAFTADARKEATRDGAPAIDLVDGETLCELLKDLRLGVKVKMVEELEIDPGFFAGI